jgi:hypothetical protein
MEPKISPDATLGAASSLFPALVKNKQKASQEYPKTIQNVSKSINASY